MPRHALPHLSAKNWTIFPSGLAPKGTLSSLFLALALGIGAGPCVAADSPLVANQDIAKAQAVGAITVFMTKGAQTCDAAGTNCHSVFGADDTPDYASLQAKATSITGVQAFGYNDPTGGAASVSAQTATLALLCGDTKTKIAAGVAFKLTACSVNVAGDAQISFKVCTAPSRGRPVSPLQNTVVCATDITSSNYRPPEGKSCLTDSCDTSAVGSQDGWSAVTTLIWKATLPAGSTDADTAKNGLALVFYPPLDGAITPSFSADSENMTAVKIIESFVNSKTKQVALGLRLAYRHTTVMSTTTLTAPAADIAHPGSHTAAWDQVTRMANNPLIAPMQTTMGNNASTCLDQLQKGLSTTGVISVCDPTYNKNGNKPGALSAQVIAAGQGCASTQQCLQQIVNTNTWTQTCKSAVPLAIASCRTTTAYTQPAITSTKTATQEICHEKRFAAEHDCVTAMDPASVLVVPRCTPGTYVDLYAGNSQFGSPGDDQTQVQYYCDPGMDPTSNVIPVQVYAHGGRGSSYNVNGSSGWQTINADFSTLHTMTDAAWLAPNWNWQIRTDLSVDFQITKTCTATDTQCKANAIFHYAPIPHNVGGYSTNCVGGNLLIWQDSGICTGTLTESCSNGGALSSQLNALTQTLVRSCYTYTPSIVATMPLDFLRPGYDVTYVPPTNSCSTYEVAQ